MNHRRELSSLSEERAAKLDAAGQGSVSVTELREVALEAGISSEAFDRALEELNARPSMEGTPGSALSRILVAPVEVPGTKLSAVIRRAGIVTFGSALGILSQILIDFGLTARRRSSSPSCWPCSALSGSP